MFSLQGPGLFQSLSGKRAHMIQRLLTLGFFVFLALPVEAAAQAAEGGLSPFAGNVGNAIWTLVIFVLVVLVRGKFAWGPVLALLQQREEFIHRALADAKRDRDEAEVRLKEYAAKIQDARTEAATIVAEARSDAARLREDLRERARTEADTLIQNAKRQIELQTQGAIREIRREAVDLSLQIASKIIQRNLSKEDNERLIADALNQVEGRH
jgi:F-type H+-transporting ATPase subunit b